MEELFLFDKIALLEKYKNEGWKTLAYFCSYTPEELFYAHKILPIRIFPEVPQDYLAVEKYFPAYICSFGRSTLNSILTDQLDGFDGYFIASACDTMRSLFHHCRQKYPGAFIPTMLFPHKGGNEQARKFLVSELNKLETAIQSFFPGHNSDESLTAAISLYKENRALIRRIIDLRINHPGVITARLMNLIYIFNNWLDKEEANKVLRHFIQLIGKKSLSTKADKPKIFVTGACCGINSIQEIFEERGCYIVNDFLTSGYRSYCDTDETAVEPVSIIADKFNERIMCPTQVFDTIERKNQVMMFMLQTIKESKANGVVFLHQKFCDPNGLFRPLLLPRLKNEGIPFIELELEQHINNYEQIATRLDAFLEILENC